MNDKKLQKQVPMKKLPGLLKKAYTQKSLDKLLKKIYIEADKNFVSSQFTEKFQKGKKELIRIPKDLMIAKSDFQQLKKIAKDVKKNKMRVKLVPLIAVVGLIAAIVITVCTFKNVIAKKILKAGCESIFEAKTEIQSVNVELLGISIRINGLAIGNKNSENYMKNLFEAENITLDMNFTQALRGKAVINDVSVSGMKFGTNRKTSCYLPPKKEKKKEKSEESAFTKALKEKSNKAIDDLKSQVTSILGGDDVDSIVANIQSQLKTPDAANNAKTNVENLVSKWKEKPNELKTQVEDFSKSVKDLQSINVNKLKTEPTKLKEYLETINNAIQTGNSMKSSFENVVNDVKKDSKTVESMTKEVADAVTSDTNLAKNMLTTITDTIKNAKTILTNALNTVGYDLLGKYYPYVKKGIDYGLEMKAKSDANSKDKAKEKKEKSVAKGKTNRLQGRTLWYSKEYPGLWIKNVSASGYTKNDESKGFSGAIQNVTSDQNLIGKPTTAEAKFDVENVNHSGKVILDVRRNSKDLLTLGYTGKGFKAKIDGSKIAKASGIPSIEGTAMISMTGAAGKSGFDATGKVDLNPVVLSSDGFSNEHITKYYKQALDSVKKLNVDFEVGYRENSGVNLGLSGNFADQFANAMENVVKSIGNDAKELAFKKINEQINNSNNEVMQKAKEFLGIEGDIDAQNTNLETIRKSLENKRTEIENQIKGAAEEKINEAKSKAEDKAKSAVNDAKNKATDSAKNAASKLFKK